MKALKATASTLLSLLLFLCLTVMGVAITLNSTALNPGFVTRQIDKLDVVALFNEEALPQLQKDDQLAAHPEVIAGIQSAVTHNAPALKTAVNRAVSDIYGYLLHGGTLDLRQTLKSSVLDPQLAISIVNDLDLSTVIRDLLAENVPAEDLDINGLNIDPAPYLDAIVPVIQPWFKQQVTLLIPKLYDFILGYSSTIDLDIPVGSVLNDIGSALKAAVLASPPPSLAGLSQAELSQAFDQGWEQILPQLPTSFEINSSEIGFEQPAGVAQGFTDMEEYAEKGLAEARRFVAYYQAGFWGLIGLTALLVLFIILVNRNVKAICRILGGTFTSYGITEAAGVLVSRGLVHSQLMSLSDVPQSLQPWLIQLSDGLMNPLLIFSISCAVLGVLLFVISFIYHHGQEKPAAA